jgi:cysteinyl-tRNA synthetase
MHNEMLQVEGKKMSKSLGNFFSVKELLDQGYSGEVIRFVFLGTHYRKPMDWTDKKAKETRAHFNRWQATLSGYSTATTPDVKFVDALCDDLNTPKAIARLHALWKSGSSENLSAMAASLKLIGIDPTFPSLNPWEEEPSVGYGLTSRDRDSITKIVSIWSEKRAIKDYSAADKIRSSCISFGLDLSAWESSDDGENSIMPQFKSTEMHAFLNELEAHL